MELSNIKTPADIKCLSADELNKLAAQIRAAIIDVVSRHGGHLASSLGVVELTMALHYVFDTPSDKIVWDVGHQAYAHKMLTGRFDRFETLRKMGGISGFPKRTESAYDAFDTGHSSTSISASLGMIEARDILGESYKVVAVIGDGAMTAGLAFEGLNHAGQLKKDLIVVLNDNEMSISENVGALSSYLNRIMTGEMFRKFRSRSKHIIESIPRVGGQFARLAERAEEGIKGLFLPGVLFEELGFTYVGPIDGHNIATLIETFKNIKTANGPMLIHVVTKKGMGYGHSEQNPSAFHGIGPFEPETGEPHSSGISYGDVMGRALCALAREDSRIAAITAAMKEGTGLGGFSAEFPDRFYDVGIAEPHAVTFAAGMAAQGARPVVAIYSTFLQRSYDEIIHDVCLQRLPVVFAIDRAGIVGEDGPTHHGVFDLSYLRHIPNLVVMAPKDAPELETMLGLALRHNGPVAIRYPRGKAIELGPKASFKIGEAQLMGDGGDIAIISIGNTVGPAIEAKELLAKDGVSVTVVNMRTLKPMDEAMLRDIATRFKHILTVEENALQGGMGSAVMEFYAINGIKANIKPLGIPDGFVEQGSQTQLRAKLGIDANGIVSSIRSLL